MEIPYLFPFEIPLILFGIVGYAKRLIFRGNSFLFRLIQGGFSQRRKTLPNPLSGTLGRPKAEISAALEEAGLKPTARAEELSLPDWAALARILRRGQG